MPTILTPLLTCHRNRPTVGDMSTRLPVRLVRLLLGLALCGASVALMVRADLGLLVNEAVTVFLRQALDSGGELRPDPGRDDGAELMLDQLARLAVALA